MQNQSINDEKKHFLATSIIMNAISIITLTLRILGKPIFESSFEILMIYTPTILSNLSYIFLLKSSKS